MAVPKSVTQLLQDWQAGDQDAINQLTPMIYDELRQLARCYMHAEAANHTLQPTALVNEAFAKLIDIDLDWKNRAHFFRIAARQMRRILVDHARAKNSQKRGSGQANVSLEDGWIDIADSEHVILELDIALGQLAHQDPRKSEIVELVFFAGLNYDETAEILGLGRTTVYRELTLAKAWLYDALDPSHYSS